MALNVALYGGERRWTMTERGRAALTRDAGLLRIGPSSLRREGDDAVFEIDEVSVPFPRRVRGTVRIRPEAMPGTAFALDAAGAHRWTPFAPRARIEVDLRDPGIAWSGPGYLDGNSGDEPLERGFARWEWARAETGRGTSVTYDAVRRDGSIFALAKRFEAGGMSDFAAPAPVPLRATGWRIARSIRADAAGSARVAATIEDTPFYARSRIDSVWSGIPVRATHESLSLDRFDSAWVRTLLPFRMPRRA